MLYIFFGCLCPSVSCFCFVKYSQQYTHTHTHSFFIPIYSKDTIANFALLTVFAFLFMFLIFGSCYLEFLKLAQQYFKVFASLLEFISYVSSKERIWVICYLGRKISGSDSPSFILCLSSLLSIFSNTKSF